MSYGKITAIWVGILGLCLSTASAKASGELPGPNQDIYHDGSQACGYARNLMEEAKQPGKPGEDVSDSLISSYNEATQSNYSRSPCGKFVSDPVTAVGKETETESSRAADPQTVEYNAERASKNARVLSAQMVVAQIFSAGKSDLHVTAPGYQAGNPKLKTAAVDDSTASGSAIN